ncbi:hypothetical protein [Actinoplanes sp. L3-i22]|uniref:hypothetical protein n=1 Tax=Actinoplanes sp. L3-i22 TaxID=2836373 RepID=UPI001C76B677|nr:hypothetical protein [Actinoplanes sp. L3-i22]BCY13377.1 hypothetical protein L3i22_084650 [Actinoplanes sp. L3-i22]
MSSVLPRLAMVTMSVATLLIGGATAALADGARFVPEATGAGWDGAVATVTFQEVDVALESAVTTISVQVTADVDATCERGASTIHPHRSATALDVRDHPISDDGVVEGVAAVPLAVAGLKVPGYTCVTTRVSLIATLEDFWTGATLTHPG